MKISLVTVLGLVLVGLTSARPDTRYAPPTTPGYTYTPPTTTPGYTYTAPTTTPRYTYTAPTTTPGYRYEAPTTTMKPAKYEYQWKVNDHYSGNDFGAEEKRDGDNTEGAYHVLLPDGRVQKVTYKVNGDSGFVAEVTYEGEVRSAKPDSLYNTPKPYF